MGLFRGILRKDTLRGTSADDVAKGLAGLVTSGPGGFGGRVGVLGGLVVSGTDSWAYRVSTGHCTLQKGNGGILLAGTDEPVTVTTDPAPGTGERWDLIWILHQDVDLGDEFSEPIVGVTKGDISAAQPYADVPSGALVLAESKVTAGSTATSSAAIVQVAPSVVARGAVVPVRNTAERDSLASLVGPSPNAPLYVHRADAIAGCELETSTGDSGFRTVSIDGGTSITLQPLAGWGQYPGSGSFQFPTIRSVGGLVYLLSGLYGRTGKTPVSAGIGYKIVNTGQIPEAWLPANPVFGSTEVHLNSIIPRYAAVRIAPDGVISWISSTSGDLLANSASYLALPNIIWEMKSSSV